ncbi:MAG: type IX secretion system membrane protein PorP/SprF [Elusimicrobiota bacterium]
MKKNKTTLLILIAAAALAATSPARAAYDDLGVSARVMGLGNAFTAVADDAYSVYYNPAGLAQLPRPEFGTSYAKLYPGLSDNSNLQNTFLVYAQPIDGGKQGGIGVGLDYFSLDSLYTETSLYASYGRDLFPEILHNKLYGGLSVKYLSRSINPGSLASQPISDTGQVLSSPDPVLQNTSRSNVDMDLGLLYKLDPRWTLGLDVQHLFEPNIAFGSTPDPLDRNYKIGAAYKTPFALLSAEIDNVTAPDYSRMEIATFAAEKWLPTLSFGTFGIRGSLGAGTDNFRQVTVGLSYKIYKMEFDYGMAVPFGGIADIYGTQRIGLTFFFGRSRTPEPSFNEALLENMGELAGVGTPEFKAQMKDISRYRREAMENFLSRVRVLSSEGRFADAYDAVEQALAISNAEPNLLESAKRLKAVSAVYPEVNSFSSDAVEVAVYEGVLDFLSGQNHAALKSLDYAQRINPSDDRIGYLKSIIGGMFLGQKAPAPALAVAVSSASVSAAKPAAQTRVSVSSASTAIPASTASIVSAAVQSDLVLMGADLSRLQYDKVIELGRQVAAIDPGNETAYLRMGVAQYALKKYKDALKALRRAVELSKDQKTKKTLNSYIEEITRISRRSSAKTSVASPEAVENLYNAGVELYTQGRLRESLGMFKKLLKIDPTNDPARKALKRVKAEILESGAGLNAR